MSKPKREDLECKEEAGNRSGIPAVGPGGFGDLSSGRHIPDPDLQVAAATAGLQRGRLRGQARQDDRPGPQGHGTGRR